MILQVVKCGREGKKKWKKCEKSHKRNGTTEINEKRPGTRRGSYLLRFFFFETTPRLRFRFLSPAFFWFFSFFLVCFGSRQTAAAFFAPPSKGLWGTWRPAGKFQIPRNGTLSVDGRNLRAMYSTRPRRAKRARKPKASIRI